VPEMLCPRASGPSAPCEQRTSELRACGAPFVTSLRAIHHDLARRDRQSARGHVATVDTMTHVDLRTVKIRSGEQFRDVREVQLEPLDLGGQRYSPVPEKPEAELTISRTTSGLLFEFALDARLVGPCFRCLTDTGVTTAVRATEYQATSAADTDELRTPYVVDNRLDLSAWARDAIALSLPDKILCRPDCAGLCPVCGKDLNLEPHEHPAAATDPRWAVLESLRGDGPDG
jgi:DUF177 domain-containing protein